MSIIKLNNKSTQQKEFENKFKSKIKTFVIPSIEKMIRMEELHIAHLEKYKNMDIKEIDNFLLIEIRNLDLLKETLKKYNTYLNK